MCDPVTLGLAALEGVSSMAGINAQNSAAVANDANAKQAANDQIATTTNEFVEKSRSLVQGGFDAVLQGRQDASSAYTSALENGVQGASIKAMLRDKTQTAGRNAGRTQQELQSLKTQTDANLKHVVTKQQARSNSVSTSSFGLGDVAGILAPIVKSQTE